MIKVFVYGTLKPGEVNYLPYCGNKVIQAVAAYTKGNLYGLPLGYPAMTEGNSRVRGFLLTFADTDILCSLDELEEYQAERSPELNEYYRQQVPVYSLTEKFLGQGWVYLMERKRVKRLNGVLLPSGWWTGVGCKQ